MWKYKIVEVNTEHANLIETMMNQYGNEGWELVSMYDVSYGNEVKDRLVFKMQVPQISSQWTDSVRNLGNAPMWTESSHYYTAAPTVAQRYPGLSGTMAAPAPVNDPPFWTPEQDRENRAIHDSVVEFMSREVSR